MSMCMDVTFIMSMCMHVIFIMSMCMDVTFIMSMCMDAIFIMFMCMDAIFIMSMCMDAIFIMSMCMDAINLSLGSQPLTNYAPDEIGLDIGPEQRLPSNSNTIRIRSHISGMGVRGKHGGSRTSLSSLGSDDSSTSSSIHPFTPGTSGWHGHLAERRLTIGSKDSYTFNDLVRTYDNGGLRFAISVPEVEYTTKGAGAEEVRAARHSCGLGGDRRASGSLINMCTFGVKSPPKATMKNGSSPTITLEGVSIPLKDSPTRPIALKVELIYDSSDIAYGAFVSDALKLEEIYKVF
ncbi:hypothetical protein FOL47_003215 [Perkinsus chesapeaki]|uniref:Uncharacterized protein n=1 Tax=Perkinsus chesapeaki TaxID=330153 RepID=A0A7J6M8U8_PERCH|nr:hypothetical protein FOL47_003215 [Perkinsus chesapeaki]